MSTKHTPGPWTCAYGRAGSFEIVSVDGSVLCIRSPWNYRCKESVDNGSLIAAAPDLLEALRALVESDGLAFYHDDDIEGTVRVCVHCHEFSQTPAEIDHDASCIVGKVRAAIAKAEGRS